MDVSSIVLGGLLAIAKLAIAAQVYTIREQGRRLQQLEVKLAEEYPKKQELAQLLERIDKKLDYLTEEVHRNNNHG